MSNIVKVIATQHQHILTLLNRIKDMEQQLTAEILKKEDWWNFIESHVDPYTMKYVTNDLPGSWHNNNLYDYDMSYSFHKGIENSQETQEIKFIDIIICIKEKGGNKSYIKSSVPLTVNIVTEPINIDELNQFLNKENNQ